MGQLKVLVLGIIIGGGLVFWLKSDSLEVMENELVKVKEVQVVGENKEVIFEKTTFNNNEEELRDINSLKLDRKEIMKTPDELFEEQEKLKYESSQEHEVEVEIDRDVIPIELEQVENSAQYNFEEPDIDRTIIPEELEAEENSAVILTQADLAQDLPELSVEEYMIEEEPKEVVSEELLTLEEYGDEGSLSYEDEIPN